MVYSQVRRECNFLDTGFTLLGSNQDDTIGSLWAVEGCCGSSFQDTHAFDIIRVQVGDTVTAITVTCIGSTTDGCGSLFVAAIQHRYTVNHIKGLVVSADRTAATNRHFGWAAQSGWTLGDLYTCCFTGKSINHIRIFGAGQFVATYLLGWVGQGGFFFLDTHGGYDYLFQCHGFFLHLYVEILLSVYLYVLWMITDIGNRKNRVAGYIKAEVAFHIGDATVCSTFLQYIGTDDGIAILVSNYSFYGYSVLLGCWGVIVVFGQNNVVPFHYIFNVGTFKCLVENFGYGFVVSLYVYCTSGIYILFVIDKQIFRLRFNLW